MKNKRPFFDIKQFSIREAFWLAILLHLILLFLPQSFNPFALFWREPEIVKAEPVKLYFQEPQQQEQTEITDIQEKQKAITPEKSNQPPETEQPMVQGQTNLKTFEQPAVQPRQQQVQPQQRQKPVEQTGEEKAEKVEETEANEKTEPSEQKTQPVKQPSQKLLDAIENFKQQPLGDVPITYDNNRPSSAEQMEGVVQFDTYNWNYQPYRARMIRKIYLAWVPKLQQIGFFRMGEPGRTVLSFRIQRNGTVTALLLRDGAQVASYDIAAQHSVLAKYPGLATEFPPLPIDFPKDFLGVSIAYFVNMEVPDEYK